MRYLKNYWKTSIAILLSVSGVLLSGLALAQPLGASPETSVPLGIVQSGRPLVMLTMARDHTLFYEAYNDASDINGDGLLDLRFNPTITYLGLFDSGLCYSYTGNTSSRSDNNGLFRPAAHAIVDNTRRNFRCTNPTHWSGNWLNWVTTSRIDALRIVLYGGYREIDTASQTILRRAYIPQDAHSWAKEYTSIAVDGYDIRDFTPFELPSGSGIRRHFFGNLTDTRNRSCSLINNCSGRAPLLRVITNAENTRVWQWATSELPVLHEANNFPGGLRLDYAVRVEVCTSTFNAGCKRYPNQTTGNFKPVGLLHEFGENNSMHFGLLTGSYNLNMSGGVLRKVVSSFANEVNPANGIFTNNAVIVNTIDSLRIRDFNNNRTDNAYRGGWVSTRPMLEGEFVDWGNPIGEMMYEVLRYFNGRSSATSSFATSVSHDGHLGLSVAQWDDPFSSSSAARASWCARSNQLVISGVNPSFDSDQLPGSYFNNFTGDLAGLNTTGTNVFLNVRNIGQIIADNEPGIKGKKFIGQVSNVFDGAPTAKTVNSLGNIRGLSPESPTQQGSFYSASVAHFGRTHDLRSTIRGIQNVETFVVALNSSLPAISVAAQGGRIFSLVPFAKSVGGAGIIDAKGDFQPTNQIVDFYVDTIANSCIEANGGVASMCADYDISLNGGRYFARFRINFEDVEQGADHDMDVVVIYEITMQSNGQLRIVVRPDYQAGGIQHRIGYVISGSTADGVYLVVQDENDSNPYHLNVPPGELPGFCDRLTPPSSCNILPGLGGGVGRSIQSDRLFNAGTASAAGFLPNPLWLAAKWGGFQDLNSNQRPDLRAEWDANLDGVPDTYFLVQNPTLLRDSMSRAFNIILERSSAAGNVSANSTFITTESAVFQSVYNSANWSGDLRAFPIDATSGVGVVPLWEASHQMPLHSDRRLFTTNAANNPSIVPFNWSGLSTSQRNFFGINNIVQQDIINYLRGDIRKEIRSGGTLRNRPTDRLTAPLGDIIHSSPVFVSDNNTVFVGSNGGFVHAFNASTGVERFAFAPSVLLQHMHLLSNPSYTRRYFVDGEMAVSQRSVTDGRNILVGFLGRGGRGLYALDVTDPATFGDVNSASGVLWENYGMSDDDMGFLLGRPVLAKIRGLNVNDAPEDVVIFGNGYNSTSGSAVLYVINLRTGALIRKLNTGVGNSATPNGLASPGLSLNADGTVRYVYAGDLSGNLWKFDLSGRNPNQWVSAFRNSINTPIPFFVATDRTGQSQPITAQVNVTRNNATGHIHYGKTYIFVGTGSYMRTTDPGDLQVQSFYALIDEGVVIAGRPMLRQRNINNTGTFNGHLVRTFSIASDGDMLGKRGWFLDWVDPPHPPGILRGERVVGSARILPTVVPSLAVSSNIPMVDPCEPGGTGYINVFNPFNGGAVSTVGILDINRINSFVDDLLGVQFIASFDPGIGLISEPVLVGDRLIVGGSVAKIADVRVNRIIASGLRGRISWREVIPR